jgi:dienelactone hydrolase
MKTKLLALALSPFVFAMGCSQEDLLPAGFSADGQVAGPVAVYSPTIAQMPLPIDLFFSGTTDLTLNLPSSSAPAQAANAMDGWSTVAPITAKFNTAVLPASIVPGVTVRVFRACIDPFSTKPTGAIGELVAGVDYTASISTTGSDATAAENTLVIKPLKPLPPKFNAQSAVNCPAGAQGDLNKGSGFIVVLTHGTTPVNSTPSATRVEITSTAGDKFGSSDFYNIARGSKCLFRSPSDSATDCPVVDAGDSGNAGTTPAGIAAGFANTAVASQVKTETLRRLTNGHHQIAVGVSAQVAAGFGANAPPTIDPDDIILAWQFSPQSIGNVISAANQVITGTITQTMQAPTLADQSIDTGHPDLINTGGTATSGKVFTGTVSLPYYLTPPSAGNPTGFLTGHWESEPNATFDNTTNLTFANPVPKKAFDQTIPVFAVVPKASIANAASLPVAIVQHGIGSNRTNIVALAEALAQAGIATVAIDMPLHGLNDSNNVVFSASGERNFGVLTSGVQSSQAFLNVSSFETGRDNLRQGIVDLLGLEELIPNMTLTSGANTMTFDTSKIYFVGHSLGGIVGTTYLANSDKVKAATLAMAGGGIAKLLDASGAFGGAISSGLAALGVNEGEKTYEDFFILAQTVIDSADPLNSAAKLAATNMPIHFIEISGGALGGNNPPDVVVPNDAFALATTDHTVPELGLGGSRPLIDALGLTREQSTTAKVVTDVPIRTAVQFALGFHSSILRPNDDPPPNGTGILAAATFSEIANEVAQFLASDGACLPISSSCAP